MKEQSQLQKNLNFLYERLNKESDTSQRPENFDKQVEDIENEIKDNEGIILAWKNFINEAKKLLNRLLNFFELGNKYNEKTKDSIIKDYAKEIGERLNNSENFDKKFGNQLSFGIAKVNKLIQDINEGKKEFISTGTKITNAQNQINSFEQANNDLYDKLFYLEEEKKELVEMLKKQSITKPSVPIVQIKNTKDIT
jgi:peptidoglycan hydrolase CwlO-like protein